VKGEAGIRDWELGIGKGQWNHEDTEDASSTKVKGRIRKWNWIGLELPNPQFLIPNSSK
jgi:hypothetical protein